jgi:hypothetical protein
MLGYLRCELGALYVGSEVGFTCQRGIGHSGHGDVLGAVYDEVGAL